MESTKLPLRELRQRYTKSEMAVAAWRSMEISHNMDTHMHTSGARGQAPPPVSDNFEIELEQQLGPSIVKKFGGENGDVDLRKLTGEEAVRYMRAIGVPIIAGVMREK